MMCKKDSWARKSEKVETGFEPLVRFRKAERASGNGLALFWKTLRGSMGGC